MTIIPFDTSRSPWLESGEIVRVKDQTDSNYDREGEVIDRTIYGGTVHFEDCDRAYRNDQLERLGQRQAVIWKSVELATRSDHGIVQHAIYRNDTCIAASIDATLPDLVIEKLIKPGDTYVEVYCGMHPACTLTYDAFIAVHARRHRFDAGNPYDDDTQPTEDDDDQDLEPIDDIFAPPVPADWYPS